MTRTLKMLSFPKLVVMLKTKFSLATAFLWLLRRFLVFCCSIFDEIDIKCFFLDYVICHTADYGKSFFRVCSHEGYATKKMWYM